MNPARLLVLLVSLPLLLGGCGEKATVEPVAEVNVKPELEGVNAEELEERGEYPDNILYLKGSDTPYTGKSFKFYDNGQKERESNLKEGKDDGLYLAWYESGQKHAEINYKDGKLDGHWVKWYGSGQKSAEGTYKNGKIDGLDVTWYEDGQKWTEGNFKDDQKDGLYTIWYTNGQKMAEQNFKDGKMDGLALYWHKNGQRSVEENYKDDKLVVSSAKYWNSKGEPVDSREEAESEN